jgi:hypothetical protein
MTRTCSLLVASTLAILPLSAFAQQAVAPSKTTDPTVTTTTTTAPVAGKTATATPAKPEVKTPAAGTKTGMHGLNTNTTHHTKVVAPAKS